MMGVFMALFAVVLDVGRFWKERLQSWYFHLSPVELWLDKLRRAETFEDWQEAALHLDTLLHLDMWRNNATSKHYDYPFINDRTASLMRARVEGSYHQLVNLLRSGLVRNLGNITSAKLHNRAFAGTKLLIEEYIGQVVGAVRDIGSLPSPSNLAAQGGGVAHSRDHHTPSHHQLSAHPAAHSSHHHHQQQQQQQQNCGGAFMTAQMKLDFFHDTRQAFGRSTLVLQGGAMFGLCHLGVVKALFLRGLLPRIITGTATGALIAALVAIHTEDELPAVLRGDGIDLSAFSAGDGIHRSYRSRWATVLRRLLRFWSEGRFLDARVLEECVRANVGDLTFEEAYNRSKRVLNITAPTGRHGGVPILLNYITAPNVLIWTAAVAFNASPPRQGKPKTAVLCRDVNGNIVPWMPDKIESPHWTDESCADLESPLSRVAELFNVNQFIVSQARPYVIPFLQSDMHGPSIVEAGNQAAQVTSFLARMVGLELRHRLRQLDTLGMLPATIRRFLVDERIPAASVTLVPDVSPSDFVRLLETPTRESLDYWILRGQRSVWPAVAALRIRCGVESELDRQYQIVRRLKAGGLRRKASVAAVPGLSRPISRHRSRR